MQSFRYRRNCANVTRTKRLSLEELDFFFAKKYGSEAELKEVEVESGKQAANAEGLEDLQS